MSCFFCTAILIHNTACYIINLNNVPCSDSYYSQFLSYKQIKNKEAEYPTIRYAASFNFSCTLNTLINVLYYNFSISSTDKPVSSDISAME